MHYVVSLTFPYLQDSENVVILRTDVAVTAERRHSDSVGIQHRKVVTVAAIYNSDAPVPGRKPARENRNEGRSQDDLLRTVSLTFKLPSL